MLHHLFVICVDGWLPYLWDVSSPFLRPDRIARKAVVGLLEKVSG